MRGIKRLLAGDGGDIVEMHQQRRVGIVGQVVEPYPRRHNYFGPVSPRNSVVLPHASRMQPHHSHDEHQRHHLLSSTPPNPYNPCDAQTHRRNALPPSEHDSARPLRLPPIRIAASVPPLTPAPLIGKHCEDSWDRQPRKKLPLPRFTNLQHLHPQWEWPSLPSVSMLTPIVTTSPGLSIHSRDPPSVLSPLFVATRSSGSTSPMIPVEDHPTFSTKESNCQHVCGGGMSSGSTGWGIMEAGRGTSSANEGVNQRASRSSKRSEQTRPLVDGHPRQSQHILSKSSAGQDSFSSKEERIQGERPTSYNHAPRFGAGATLIHESPRSISQHAHPVRFHVEPRQGELASRFRVQINASPPPRPPGCSIPTNSIQILQSQSGDESAHVPPLSSPSQPGSFVASWSTQVGDHQTPPPPQDDGGRLVGPDGKEGRCRRPPDHERSFTFVDNSDIGLKLKQPALKSSRKGTRSQGLSHWSRDQRQEALFHGGSVAAASTTTLSLVRPKPASPGKRSRRSLRFPTLNTHNQPRVSTYLPATLANQPEHANVIPRDMPRRHSGNPNVAPLAQLLTPVFNSSGESHGVRCKLCERILTRLPELPLVERWAHFDCYWTAGGGEGLPTKSEVFAVQNRKGECHEWHSWAWSIKNEYWTCEKLFVKDALQGPFADLVIPYCQDKRRPASSEGGQTARKVSRGMRNPFKMTSESFVEVHSSPSTLGGVIPSGQFRRSAGREPTVKRESDASAEGEDSSPAFISRRSPGVCGHQHVLRATRMSIADVRAAEQKSIHDTSRVSEDNVLFSSRRTPLRVSFQFDPFSGPEPSSTLVYRSFDGHDTVGAGKAGSGSLWRRVRDESAVTDLTGRSVLSKAPPQSRTDFYRELVCSTGKVCGYLSAASSPVQPTFSLQDAPSSEMMQVVSPAQPRIGGDSSSIGSCRKQHRNRAHRHKRSVELRVLSLPAIDASSGWSSKPGTAAAKPSGATSVAQPKPASGRIGPSRCVLETVDDVSSHPFSDNLSIGIAIRRPLLPPTGVVSIPSTSSRSQFSGPADPRPRPPPTHQFRAGTHSESCSVDELHGSASENSQSSRYFADPISDSSSPLPVGEALQIVSQMADPPPIDLVKFYLSKSPVSLFALCPPQVTSASPPSTLPDEDLTKADEANVAPELLAAWALQQLSEGERCAAESDSTDSDEDWLSSAAGIVLPFSSAVHMLRRDCPPPMPPVLDHPDARLGASFRRAIASDEHEMTRDSTPLLLVPLSTRRQTRGAAKYNRKRQYNSVSTTPEPTFELLSDADEESAEGRRTRGNRLAKRVKKEKESAGPPMGCNGVFRMNKAIAKATLRMTRRLVLGLPIMDSDEEDFDENGEPVHAPQSVKLSRFESLLADGTDLWGGNRQMDSLEVDRFDQRVPWTGYLIPSVPDTQAVSLRRAPSTLTNIRSKRSTSSNTLYRQGDLFMHDVPVNDEVSRLIAFLETVDRYAGRHATAMVRAGLTYDELVQRSQKELNFELSKCGLLLEERRKVMKHIECAKEDW